MVIKMEYKITSRSEQDTVNIAENLESEKLDKMVICLEGELGSGKTMFTKGFAYALGIKENITSPTFNIIKEYFDGESPLYHMDVYRLDGIIDGVGIEDYFDKDGIIIIEWSDTIKEYLPEERLDIRFRIIDEETRILTFIPHGKEYEDICEAIL